MREADLLAILDAGPIDPGALATLSRSRRKSALLGIDALIDLLDAIDAPGADLEPDADEEDGADDEHSLGSPEVGHVLEHGVGRILRGGTLNQERWGMGSRCPFTSEAEDVDEDGGDINDEPQDEHDGREPDVDEEPALGSLEARWDQSHWSGLASEQGRGESDGGQDGWRRPRRLRMPHTESAGSMARRIDLQLDRLLNRPPVENLRLIRVVGEAR